MWREEEGKGAQPELAVPLFEAIQTVFGPSPIVVSNCMFSTQKRFVNKIAYCHSSVKKGQQFSTEARISLEYPWPMEFHFLSLLFEVSTGVF